MYYPYKVLKERKLVDQLSERNPETVDGNRIGNIVC